MKIEKIHMHNFRQFSGDTIVEFSTDENKNITVIHAMNGSGKTTFLQSFYWALYGNINLPNGNRLLNENLFADMNNEESKEVFIEITATHEDALYIIKRSLNVTKDLNGNMKNSKILLELNYTDKSGKSKYLDAESKAQDKINSIIPEKLARYFFFDGERIESLGENTAKARKDIANGIKNILNITTYDELKKVLEKKVVIAFQNEIKSGNTDKLNDLLQTKSEVITSIDDYEKQKNNLQEEKEKLGKRIEELNHIILKNETAVEYQNRLNDNKEKIAKLESEIEDIVYGRKGTKKESLPKAYTKLTISRLLNKLKDSVEINLDVASVDENVITGINTEAVDQILEKKQCICGRLIGNDEKIRLENLRQYLPPHDQRMLVYGYKEKYFERIESLKDVDQEKDNLIAKYFELKEEVDKLYDDNKELNKKLDSVESVKDYNDERNQKEHEKDEVLKEIGKLDSKLDELKDKLKNLDNEIGKCAAFDDYNGKTAKRIDFVNNMINILDHNIDKKKKDIHDKLTYEVNSIFASVSHKNTKEVIIDEDYSYKIRDKVTQHEALSEGEAIITSLSFIASIIKIAKDLEEQKKSEVGEGVEYPLVLDAPFAKLDSVHIKGIAPVLPKFADQVILLTVDQQFRGVTEGNIIDSIGIEYDMRNIMDKEVIIERVK